MNAQVAQEDLAAALASVLGSVASAPPLSGVLLEANMESMQLILTTTNLEMFTRVKLEAEFIGSGKVLVPHSQFAAMVRSLRGGLVKLASDDRELLVRGGRFKGDLRILPHDEFPTRGNPAVTTTATVNGKSFAAAIRGVARAASSDELRPAITGVKVEISGGTLSLAATDTYRLATCEIEPEGIGGEGSGIVPAKAMVVFGKLADGEGNARLSLSRYGATIEAKGGDVASATRLIAADYPNFRSRIPDHLPGAFETDRTEFLAALDRVSAVADGYSPLKLSFDPQEQTVRMALTSAGTGSAEETVEGFFSGEAEAVAFNPKYLRDGIDAAGDDRVRIEFDKRMGLIRGADFTYIVMGVRV